MDKHAPINAYIGTYTRNSTSQGIYQCRFDPVHGSLTVIDVCGGIQDPTYLALSHDGKTLYAASESTDVGELHAYRIGVDGHLEPLGSLALPAKSLCHLACDRGGTLVVGSGYRSGNVLAVKLHKDGSIDALTSDLPHSGQSAHPVRQTCPHVHSAAFSPDGRFAMVCDLGTDSIYVYVVDPVTGILSAGSVMSVTPGSGPRHMAFARDAGRLYVVTELSNQVITYGFDRENGSLQCLHTCSSLPEGCKDESAAAHIQISPDGRYLYVSNRGADVITCFALDAQGRPTRLDAYGTSGKTPRHFAITSDGRYLIVANQDSDTVAVFPRDTMDGGLSTIRSVGSIPSPSCILLA